MEKYNEQIATNDKVELIQLSQDDDEDAADEWAVSLSAPWPVLYKDDIKEKTFIEPYFLDGRMGVPTYILIDAQGKELARGLTTILSTLKD